MNDRLRRLKDKANKLPLTPGVYIMKDKTGKIIYIGKAKALKNRVSQYFGSQEKHLTKVRKMVEMLKISIIYSPIASSRRWCLNAVLLSRICRNTIFS